MFLKENANPDGAPVHMDWDQAQAALRTGGYEIISEGGDESTRSEPIVPNLPAAPVRRILADEVDPYPTGENGDPVLLTEPVPVAPSGSSEATPAPAPKAQKAS